MRERSRTTPRRRGPKLPLPPPRRDVYEEQFETSESPYYTIDNTEDIYGTTLLPSQRCYVDPWDLENYDYVRKKLNTTPTRSTPERYYDTSLSASPYYMPPSPPLLHEELPLPLPLAPPQRLAVTMPRNRRRSHWNQPCELECCTGLPPAPRRRYDDTRSELYGVARGKYDDYMLHMTQHLQADDEDLYTGYGGFSSSSSTERPSSIEDDCLLLPTTAGYGAGVGIATQRRALAHPKPAPQLEFPAPPPLPPPTYDYCNPYATLPYCSVSDCYDCSLIYAAPPSLYGAIGDGVGSGSGSGGDGGGSNTIYGSTLGRRPSSSLYSGIYGHKFGLSKKGLLQIDYSCSWNDLDRVMGGIRHY